MGTSKNYNTDYSNSYYPANTKDSISQVHNQQFTSTQYQPNYPEVNNNAGYMPVTPQSYQFPLATKPNYQYISKVTPQYYYVNTPHQNSALNYDQNIYQTVAATNQYTPTANNGYYYNTNTYSSEPQYNKHMYYVNDEYKTHGSNMQRYNNRMYNLGSLTGYENRYQRKNQYDDRYNQQAVYMPIKEISPPQMYYMMYVNKNIAPGYHY
ncbi:hypothetical protein CBL_01528 [Carabus blaptoides fortunei]